MKQHNNTAYVNVREMSDWEFTNWTGGWTRGQAQTCMMTNLFSPMPARAGVPGARMSASEPGRVWVENFQKPLLDDSGWFSSAERMPVLIDVLTGEIGQ